MPNITKHGWYKLEYVTVVLPCDEKQRIHASTLSIATAKVAKELLRRNLPIRGRELRYLRKVVAGLSMERLGEALGRRAATIQNWEDAETKPLDQLEAIGVRLYFAELLGVEIRSTYSELAKSWPIQEIEIEAKLA